LQNNPAEFRRITGFTGFDPSKMRFSDVVEASDKILNNIRRNPTNDMVYREAADFLVHNDASGFYVFTNGNPIDFSAYDNVMPVIMNGRTLVPLRSISEYLGATVYWSPSTSVVRITYNKRDIQLKLASDLARIDGKNVKVDVPAVSINGRTMVPIRFISETFGMNILWFENGNVKIIVINGPN
jgi:hypothetical protein